VTASESRARSHRNESIAELVGLTSARLEEDVAGAGSRIAVSRFAKSRIAGRARGGQPPARRAALQWRDRQVTPPRRG